jgi:hypothetical protein
MWMLLHLALFMRLLLVVTSLQAVTYPDGETILHRSPLVGLSDAKPLLRQSIVSTNSTSPASFTDESAHNNVSAADLRGYFRDSTGVVTKYIFDAHTSGNGGDSTFSGNIVVEYGEMYDVKIEALRCDLAGISEYVKSVKLGGIDFGECHPDGGDYDCTYFDCGLNAVVGPTMAYVTAEVTTTDASKDCDCDEDTGECSKEANQKNGRTPVKGGIRFTLTPRNLDGERTLSKVIYMVDGLHNDANKAWVTVSSKSGRSYQVVTNLGNTDKTFTDRDYRFTSLGDFTPRNGFAYIRCANDDKNTASGKWQYTLNSDVAFTVYLVYYRTDHSKKRKWIESQGWISGEDGYKLPTWDVDREPFKEVRSKSFDAGDAHINGNNGDGKGLPAVFVQRRDEAFSGAILVEKGRSYTATVEVLRSDLGDASEYVRRISLGGQELGECHPDGGDYDCTWFSCFSGHEVYAHDDKMDLQVTLSGGHSCNCVCPDTWACAERTSSTGVRTKAAVRVTLDPLPTTTTTLGPTDPPSCTGECGR